jgi:hypothetical protein
LDDARNSAPEAKPEEGENIEVMLFEIPSLLHSMEQLAERDGLVIDAKCFSLALGMSMNSKI